MTQLRLRLYCHSTVSSDLIKDATCPTPASSNWQTHNIWLTSDEMVDIDDWSCLIVQMNASHPWEGKSCDVHWEIDYIRVQLTSDPV
jgi:hypothetical protein